MVYKWFIADGRLPVDPARSCHESFSGNVVKRIVFLFVFLIPCASFAASKADLVLVIKSEAMLYLVENGEVFKSFPVVFGANPVGHKKRAGDNRTPEGHYILDFKNEDSAFYKSIRISYPNEKDITRAAKRGLDPGGNIMIHGQRNGYGHLAPVMQQYNWTEGCIAVTNYQMDVIWDAVEVGTPITIMP